MRSFDLLVLLVSAAFVLLVPNCDAYVSRPYPSISSPLQPYRTKSIHILDTSNPVTYSNNIPNKSEEPKLAEWQKHLPNALTMLRMAAIPLMILAFVLNLRATMCGLYVLSCVTDFFDGFLARRWKVTSSFGKLWDPVADKLTVTTVLVLLCAQFPALPYVLPVLLILLREITVSALREHMAAENVQIPVSNLGKIKTTLQMLASLCLACVYNRSRDLDVCAALRLPKEAVFLVGLVGMQVACVLTLWSGWEYVRGVANRTKK
eukprot:gene30724-37124_t